MKSPLNHHEITMKSPFLMFPQNSQELRPAVPPDPSRWPRYWDPPASTSVRPLCEAAAQGQPARLAHRSCRFQHDFPGEHGCRISEVGFSAIIGNCIQVMDALGKNEILLEMPKMIKEHKRNMMRKSPIKNIGESGFLHCDCLQSISWGA